MIKLSEETFHLHPLSENLSQRFKRSVSPFPHILVKTNTRKKAFLCDAEGTRFSRLILAALI